MMRALFAGVSGLRNHQTELDVIGNNIANVSTTGFKASRVTFKEAFVQQLQGALRPPGNTGGINPIQIGTGMSIGSIDQLFTQGGLESTGQRSTWRSRATRCSCSRTARATCTRAPATSSSTPRGT